MVNGRVLFGNNEQCTYLYMLNFGHLDRFGFKIGFLESVLKSINHAVLNCLNIKELKIIKKFFSQLLKNFLYFLVQNSV